MFRYKRGAKVGYNRQGYIYFLSRLYRELSPTEQQKIRALCRESGGVYERALFEFVTTDKSATAISMKYHISESTLYRMVRKYYEAFFAPDFSVR